MAFGIQDFRDLVRLLEEHPEWRAELRRLVLTEELLALPALVQGLAQRVEALERAVSELTAAQARTEQALQELARRVEQLTDAQIQSNRRLDRADQRLPELRGEILERRYREHAGAYFDDVIRRAAPLSGQQIADLLDAPEAEGQLTRAERRDLLWTELVVRGRRWDDGSEVYLVVEVSAGIGTGDVERAAHPAGLLGRLRPSLPVVAGEWIAPEAERLADASGVWRVLDARLVAPNGHRE